MCPRPVQLPGGGRLTFERPLVMGVLNVTPDSFSDGGRYLSVQQAVGHARELAEQGADILDVGGESTRPGAESVSPQEQIRRVVPVIEALSDLGVPISVDTTSSEVARAALSAGADIVNDISAFRFDPRMLRLLAETGCGAVAMHTLARPATMQVAPSYEDVVAEVVDHLRERTRAAEHAGVDPGQVLWDPGIGFGKTLDHNLCLLRAIPRMRQHGHAVLVGTSRKSMLGQLTGRPVQDRLAGSVASAAVAVAHGAHVVRVHDVAQTVDAVRVAAAMSDTWGEGVAAEDGARPLRA